MSLSRQPLEDILAGPVKQLMWELRKRCRVKIIDEFRTSKICSKCEGLFCKPQRFWALRTCRHMCLTLWNRDVNAARNIRNIFLHMNQNEGERPEVFKRA